MTNEKKIDWEDFNKKNKEFAQKLNSTQKSYHYMTDIEFKNNLLNIEKEVLKEQLNKMRSEREFYKKILQEPYYVEHPEKKNTIRYEDSLLKYNSINSKGKIIAELLKS
jgi:hypothetical protein